MEKNVGHHISDTWLVRITFTIDVLGPLTSNKKQQLQEHIISEATRQMWGDPETISDKLIRHWLEWIGH